MVSFYGVTGAIVEYYYHISPIMIAYMVGKNISKRYNQQKFESVEKKMK